MPRWLQYVFAGFIALLVIGGPCAYARHRHNRQRNFHVVREGVLYRSGQLSLEGLKRVAHDYLGPAAASRITCTYEFAQEWTRREAQLKCCGLGITEWDATQNLRYGKTMMLALPDGYVGSVVEKNLPKP